MPIYCYRCKKCGYEQEIFSFKINEKDSSNHMPCQKCGVCLWEKLPPKGTSFVFGGELKNL